MCDRRLAFVDRVVHRPRLAWLLALVCATEVIAGCERLDRVTAFLRDRDLEFHYIGSDAGDVERASVSVSSDHRVIATARRSQARATGNPPVTEITIEETHFVKGTQDVIYFGRVTFSCHDALDFCSPVRVSPTSGTRPRNVFWRWPASMDAGIPPSVRQ